MVTERFAWDGISERYAEIFRAHLAFPRRILIATPLFPPALGGPAGYAEHLAGVLAAKGSRVLGLSYGKAAAAGLPAEVRLRTVSLRIPDGLRHAVYFAKALRLLRQCDAAILLDPFIVGVPAALACRILKRSYAIRVEGDFLWEQHIERTGHELTLRQFYERLPALDLSLKERLIRAISQRVFSGAARVVFSSCWRREIFSLGYQVRAGKTALIEPPWPQVTEIRNQNLEIGSRERVLLYAGRFVKVKNLERLIRAFLAVAPAGWRLELVGDGPERKSSEFRIQNSEFTHRIVVRPPLKPEALRRRIAEVHAFVLPSLSDVSPNVILECLAAGTPFLLTRETGFYEALKDVGLFCDPLDEQDIAAKLHELLDPGRYATYREQLRGFSRRRSWEEVAGEWLDPLS